MQQRRDVAGPYTPLLVPALPHFLTGHTSPPLLPVALLLLRSIQNCSLYIFHTFTLPLLHAGHAAFRAVFERVVSPAAKRFGPDAVLVSAGYDGHEADALSGGAMHTQAYGWLVAAVASLSEELCGPGRCGA